MANVLRRREDPLQCLSAACDRAFVLTLQDRLAWELATEHCLEKPGIGAGDGNRTHRAFLKDQRLRPFTTAKCDAPASFGGMPGTARQQGTTTLETSGIDPLRSSDSPHSCHSNRPTRPLVAHLPMGLDSVANA